MTHLNENSRKAYASSRSLSSCCLSGSTIIKTMHVSIDPFCEKVKVYTCICHTFEVEALLRARVIFLCSLFLKKCNCLSVGCFGFFRCSFNSTVLKVDGVVCDAFIVCVFLLNEAVKIFAVEIYC